MPAFQGYAAIILASPSFLSNFSAETDNFITAVNSLPATYPSDGTANAYVLALGKLLASKQKSLPEILGILDRDLFPDCCQ